MTKYISFPDAMSVACTGLGTEATLHVTPTESMSTFPALLEFLYVFGVNVTNPSVTADVNTWRLLVTDRTSRQEDSIVGYPVRSQDICDSRKQRRVGHAERHRLFPGTILHPSADGSGDEQFRQRHSAHRDARRFYSPTSTSTFCLYWSGLYEVGLSDAVAVSNSMSCQSEASNQITLHNRGDAELTAIEHVFNVTVRNPNSAQEARTWHFATYQSEAALDDDLIDEAYMTGFPVNSRLPSVFMEALPARQQSAGSNATWVVRFELVNELLSGELLVLIGPQEYEFDISGECRNVVSSLAAPSCSGNVLLVSNVGVSDAPDDLCDFGGSFREKRL